MSELLTPAAVYLRMSTEHQQYSIANQTAVITKYAKQNLLDITHNYEDGARSGLSLKRRNGLSRLLHDVTSGDCPFEAILVYDVSRWGRFPDSDEAAHYEFLCKSAGVPIHYCAEPFKNDGQPMSLVLKSVKRIMAAEYSIGLSDRVQMGMVRLAKMGFHMGSTPKLGFRRILISSDRRRNRLLRPGEEKVLATDRVILVPGPKRERELVKQVFRMALTKNCVETARILNERGIRNGGGHEWGAEYVRSILRCPLYAGHAVWGTTTQKLRTSSRAAEPWLVPTEVAARLHGEPFVDQKTFDRVQVLLKSRSRRTTDDEIVQRATEVLQKEGRLTDRILRRHGLGGGTIAHHFGSYGKFFKLLGYEQPKELRLSLTHFQDSRNLRKLLAVRIAQLWMGIAVVEQNSVRTTVTLDETPVCITTCRYSPKPSGLPMWHFSPIDNHRHMLTLLAPLNTQNNGFRDFYLFPPNSMVKYRGYFGERSHWLARGKSLNYLTELFDEVRALNHQTKSATA
jgi:DNA invertase Pin-like site-specific DNA recombinase